MSFWDIPKIAVLGLKIGKMSNQQAICCKCGDKFERIVVDQITKEKIRVGRKAGTADYCGYCAAVIFGEPDNRWLPKLGKRESIPPGYQKI